MLRSHSAEVGYLTNTSKRLKIFLPTSSFEQTISIFRNNSKNNSNSVIELLKFFTFSNLTSPINNNI